MPTLLTINGVRFFFYSNENKEPVHVHVTKGNASGKIWLEPLIEIVYFDGFTKAEEKAIMEAILLNIEEFKIKWNEHFSK
jgi:hypothetical protein